MKKHLNFINTCGYVTFLKTGVKDIGCEEDVVDVCLQRPQRRRSSAKALTKKDNNIPAIKTSSSQDERKNSVVTVADLMSPNDDVDISTFQKRFADTSKGDSNRSPSNSSPANEYRSADCNELLESELDTLAEKGLISQASIEIPIEEGGAEREEEVYEGEDWTILEVQFGVPLFDFDCNTRICQSLANSLLTEERYVTTDV